MNAAQAILSGRFSASQKDQVSDEMLNKQFADLWNSDQKVRAEFGSKENLIAYGRAMQRGRMKVLSSEGTARFTKDNFKE